ncbi:MAG: hypothetical protein PHR66_01265 [Desulfuromonadaceae bacterium]|nr:hypothetical protein [Desulfuromonadaceae bacterium]
MSDSIPKPDTLPQRFCTEIQLFDLCDLDSCKHKNGRFCNDPLLLGHFERIAEVELRTPDRYLIEGAEDDEADEVDEYGNGDDEFATGDSEGGEDSGWKDKE